MNHVSLLQKLAPLGLAAVGAIAATSIATTPAQAFVFQDGSTLNWADTTNDFFGDVNLRNNNDTLQVIFNPTNSNIFINDATGSFATAFTPSSADTITNDPIIANFMYQQSAFKNELRYVLKENIEWDFGLRTLTDHFGVEQNGVLKWVVPQGTEFSVSFGPQPEESVELALCLDTCVSVPYFEFNGETFGAPPNSEGEVVQGVFQDTVQNTLVFQDASTPANGGYTGGGVVVGQGTPEPASVLGLLTFAGLGLGLKRKQQA